MTKFHMTFLISTYGFIKSVTYTVQETVPVSTDKLCTSLHFQLRICVIRKQTVQTRQARIVVNAKTVSPATVTAVMTSTNAE